VGTGRTRRRSWTADAPAKFLGELRDHLQDPETRYKPFRKAVSSGHGIGKSTELSWVAHWAISTFEDAKVIIMAGTGDQLKTKTQPEVAKWFRMAVNAELFDVNVTSVKVRDVGHESTWRIDFNTWSEENPQATAGAHNKGKRLVVIYDEAAGIPAIIWETQEGALTDANTEIIWIAFSQCTQAEGAFYEAVFGSQRHRWNPEVIDSRTVEGVNVEEINATIEAYGGEDSDQARIRYRGLFPLAGGGKFIGMDIIQAAQKRRTSALADEPLIAGVDLAWGGEDASVARFRKGHGCALHPAGEGDGRALQRPGGDDRAVRGHPDQELQRQKGRHDVHRRLGSRQPCGDDRRATAHDGSQERDRHQLRRRSTEIAALRLPPR
jgi:hypothetical protein